MKLCCFASQRCSWTSVPVTQDWAAQPRRGSGPALTDRAGLPLGRVQLPGVRGGVLRQAWVPQRKVSCLPELWRNSSGSPRSALTKDSACAKLPPLPSLWMVPAAARTHRRPSAASLAAPRPFCAFPPSFPPLFCASGAVMKCSVGRRPPTVSQSQAVES